MPGSQSAVVLSADGHWLFAVNAGSNDVSAFSVNGGTLHLTDTISARGTDPISLTVYRSLLYVLDAGDASLNAFQVHADGTLTFLASYSSPAATTGLAAR